MGKTNIEWATDVWNPVTGCTKVSEGCRHCYAERMVKRLGHRVHGWEAGPEPDDAPFGHVILHPEKLDQPLHWRKPRRVFVCSMGDLFHEDVPDEFVFKVFDRMAAATRHTFMVLTKRPDRMRAVVGDWLEGYEPLSNAWLGVSVENQATADERIPPLLQTPAAVRFVSCEPILGPVHLWRRQQPSGRFLNPGQVVNGRGLDWVICGGESGPGARPCEIRWIESIVGQCKEAGVPVFVKQLGADPRWSGAASKPIEHSRGKNAYPEQWPVSLRVQEVPNA